jgi:hypothetical protein
VTNTLAGLAESRNASCRCVTLERSLLREQLEQDSGLTGLLTQLRSTHPNLFSSTAVFLSQSVAASIQASISAIERVIALPQYRSAAMSVAPEVAREDFGPEGVFTSYDFHLSGSGPRLIEINTNAGGALLNAVLLRAQRKCCTSGDALASELPDYGLPDTDIVAMFNNEWRLQRGSTSPQRLLIVDDEPATQYLAPEFELFRRLFQRHGIETAIADPRDLDFRNGRLRILGAGVDLIYNRLTDFYLADVVHEPLNAAYRSGAVVLTPNPHTHALYAAKTNLAFLSDAPRLVAWGVSEADQRLLAATVPLTRLVTEGNAEQLWAERRRMFFKPFAGFGARATYRGDKLTKSVWEKIRTGGFVAQELIPPTERIVDVDGTSERLKFDLRAYAYKGRIQLLAARLYRGQTTNMRTPGGGFAPVLLTRS